MHDFPYTIRILMTSFCIKLLLNLSVDRNIVSTGSGNVGAIVGGVVGAALPAVILIIIIVVVILACLRRKSKSAQQLPSDQMKFELERNKAYASTTDYISIEKNVAYINNYFQTTPQIPTEVNVAYGLATPFGSQ